MRYQFVFILCLMAEHVTSQIPNVYEFCSALMQDNRVSERCNGECPQGRAGKRGPEGRRGPLGPKGDRGEEGSCEALERKLEFLGVLVANMLSSVSPDVLANLCGLGVKSGRIPDSAITASSKWDDGWQGSSGRLDSNPYVWIARPSEVGQWIQIDLEEPTAVSGVITQGRPGRNQWIKSFKLACGNDTSAWNIVSENGSEKTFTANTDSNGKVVNILENVIFCRYIRLYPQSWSQHISMRMELLGGGCSTLLN